MFSNGTNSQSLVGLTPTGVNSLSNTSFNIPKSLPNSLNTLNTTANLGSKFFNNLGSLGLGSKVGGIASKASGLLGKVGGVGGVGDVMGVVSGVTDFFGAQGNTSQKQMQRGDAAVNTVAAGLSFIPGFGQAAGAALKLTNNLGKGLIKQPSIMKQYSTNQNVMSNSAAFGGVADKATDAEATRNSFKNSGIAGRLVGRNNSTRKRFEKAINQQSQTQTLLDQNQMAMDNAGSSADLFNTRTQFNKMGGSNLINRGMITFGKKGMKFYNGGRTIKIVADNRGRPAKTTLSDIFSKLNEERSFNLPTLSSESGNKAFKSGVASTINWLSDHFNPVHPSVKARNMAKDSTNSSKVQGVVKSGKSGNDAKETMQAIAPPYLPVINGVSQNPFGKILPYTPNSPVTQSTTTQPVKQNTVAPTPSKNKGVKNSPVVSELWKSVTGTDWSQARASGLTDGSLKSNLVLLNRLKAGENPLATLEQQVLQEKQDFKDKLHKSFAASITKSSNSVNNLTFPKTL